MLFPNTRFFLAAAQFRSVGRKREPRRPLDWPLIRCSQSLAIEPSSALSATIRSTGPVGIEELTAFARPEGSLNNDRRPPPRRGCRRLLTARGRGGRDGSGGAEASRGSMACRLLTRRSPCYPPLAGLRFGLQSVRFYPLGVAASIAAKWASNLPRSQFQAVRSFARALSDHISSAATSRSILSRKQMQAAGEDGGFDDGGLARFNPANGAPRDRAHHFAAKPRPHLVFADVDHA